MINREKIKEKAEDLVKQVRDALVQNPGLELINADQSGFLMELHGARSLAFSGEKTVERKSQTASALTHSYTVLPMIYYSGKLAPKLFVVLKEKDGILPQGIYQAPNLYITAGKSHIMGKELLQVRLNRSLF